MRLNHEMAEHHYSRIEGVGMDGGYLDGLRIRFSDHLNTAIGGRGTVSRRCWSVSAMRWTWIIKDRRRANRANVSLSRTWGRRAR